MQNLTYFSALKNITKCLFCKHGNNCSARYSTDHKIRSFEISKNCENEKETKKEKEAETLKDKEQTD